MKSDTYWGTEGTLCSKVVSKSSWWCEISMWLLWNTIGKLISDFQNPQKIWPWGHFFRPPCRSILLNNNHLSHCHCLLMFYVWFLEKSVGGCRCDYESVATGAVQIIGLPPDIPLRYPSSYGRKDLKKILENGSNITFSMYMICRSITSSGDH